MTASDNSKNFQTDDFVFVAYWLLKGEKILTLSRNGGRVFFDLGPEAETAYNDWQLIPTEEQELIKKYESHRRAVLRTIKSSDYQMKGNSYGKNQY